MDDRLSRAARALAWRVACATAMVPYVILPGFVGYYPITLIIGTMVLLGAGILASGVAASSMIRAYAAEREWLVLAAAGIAAWAASDAILLRAVWLAATTSAQPLLSISTLGILMWFLPGLGVVATIAFTWIATPGRHRLHLSMVLTLVTWFMLHHWFVLDPGLLTFIRESDQCGYGYGAVVVLAVELFLIALSVTATICVVRVARSIGASGSRPLPRAVARSLAEATRRRRRPPSPR